jgi:hypothetical protein
MLGYQRISRWQSIRAYVDLWSSLGVRRYKLWKLPPNAHVLRIPNSLLSTGELACLPRYKFGALPLPWRNMVASASSPALRAQTSMSNPVLYVSNNCEKISSFLSKTFQKPFPRIETANSHSIQRKISHKIAHKISYIWNSRFSLWENLELWEISWAILWEIFAVWNGCKVQGHWKGPFRFAQCLCSVLIQCAIAA